MNRAADRPDDANRDPGARPGRAPESAEFAVARVGGGNRWSPFAVTVLAAVLMGMVGIAVGSRLATAPPVIPDVVVAATSLVPIATATPLPLPSSRGLRIPIVPVETSDPASTKIRLAAQRDPARIFVHGDVYVARVTWVFVTLRESTGTVTGWASVSVPGATGPGKRDGPTMRFDVELGVPAEFTGALTIQATAYDGTGHVVGATQLLVSAEPAP